MSVGPNTPAPQQPQEQAAPYAGMGPFLEQSDTDVFKQVHDLVLRQERLALNHLAIDTHYTYVKLGYPWSTLDKLPNQDIYRQKLPFGSAAISIQGVPNKACDLVNKATETLLVDFPKYDVQPLNDSEEAERAAEMADRFLDQDATENGTNDAAVFYQALDGALTCASRYIHLWTDPSGGGYVPLQIKAHPQAQDIQQPLLGPDGMPTANPILRYVTKDGQFTDDPIQAAPQWQPKIRADVLGREHIRIYPETATIDRSEKTILLWYCTLGEARRRWPETVGAMDQQQLTGLCDWVPVRYLALLPPFERARWKLTNNSDKEKGGASDERLMFYYHVYQRALPPDYPKGAEVIVSGANNGIILDKRTLTATVQVTGNDGQGPKPDERCMDIPIAQLTPRMDPDERDPSGRPYIELFAGATEMSASLATGFMEVLDRINHTERFINSLSPVNEDQVENSRATGSFIPLLGPTDKPIYGETPPVPPSLLQIVEWNDVQIDSIASLPQPVQGGSDQQEVSGKAREIAVQQGTIALNRMQKAVASTSQRYGRIKVQLAMRDYTTPQQMRYVGDDGSYKQQEWTGVDFALVGDVGIKAGTGTMRTPESKVQYIGNLAMGGLMDPLEAREAARESFASSLGLPESPHQQYIERCVALWLEGPPAGDPQAGVAPWLQQAAMAQQAMQQYEQSVGPEKQAYSDAAHMAQQSGQPVPPPPNLPPAPPPAWTPFAPRPNDDEPDVAQRWQKRLSEIISSAKFDAFPPLWQQTLVVKYQAARQVIAQAQAAQMAAQQGPQGQPGQQGQQPPQKPPQQQKAA